MLKSAVVEVGYGADESGHAGCRVVLCGSVTPPGGRKTGEINGWIEGRRNGGQEGFCEFLIMDAAKMGI